MNKVKMIEKYGDFWEIKGDARCITTNGSIRKNGNAIMGVGIALYARNKCLDKRIDLEKILGKFIRDHGNHVFYLGNNLFSFPTKHEWTDKKSDIELIKRSTKELLELTNILEYKRIIMTRPGTRNGKLDWKDVKQAIENILDNRFIVVQKIK